MAASIAARDDLDNADENEPYESVALTERDLQELDMRRRYAQYLSEHGQELPVYANE
jgi:hypothetical protein